jgi:hypothetical protein
MNAPTTTNKPKYPEVVSENAEVLTVRFTGDVVSIFSPADKDLVLSRNWVPIQCGNRIYLKDSRRIAGKPVTVYLHRLILGSPKDLTSDHISRDTLDNRRSNLRVLTKSRNSMNRTKSAGKTSCYLGVTFLKKSKRWLARATVLGHVHVIGKFHSQDEAALARNAFVQRQKDEPFTLNVIGKPITTATPRN